MSYAATILADSIASGVRLSTLLVTMPRFLLPQFEKHRVFSISAESSRAVPVKKRIREVLENPVVPLHWGRAQAGMVAKEELGDVEQEEARAVWLNARDVAVRHAEWLLRLGEGEAAGSVAVHKQVANRLLEPFLWVRLIVSATEWDNFFALRLAEDAQPEMQKVAQVMKAAMDGSEPTELQPGEWHLPMVEEAYDFPPTLGLQPGTDAGWKYLASLCAARCARISYLTHDGRRDVEADRALYEKLASKGHMTPLEHSAVVAKAEWNGYEGYGAVEYSHGGIIYCADAGYGGDFIGNFRAPWVQLRKTIPGEAVFRGEVCTCT